MTNRRREACFRGTPRKHASTKVNERHEHERRRVPPEPLDVSFPSRNNRLARYYVFGPQQAGQPLLRTVKYVYQTTGNLSDTRARDNGPVLP